MTIATPEGIVFEGKVDSAKFPGASGSFSALTVGKLVYTQDGHSTELTIQGGFVEIKNDIISACVEI